MRIYYAIYNWLFLTKYDRKILDLTNGALYGIL